MPRELMRFDGDMIIEEIEFYLPVGNNMTPDEYLKKLTREFEEQSKTYSHVVLPTTDQFAGIHGFYMRAVGSRQATPKELELREQRRAERAAFEQQEAEEQERRERAEFERLLMKYT